MKKQRLTFSILAIIFSIIFTSSVFAAPSRIRVVNDTKSVVYIHKGGFAPSVKINPGQWKIFYYPFTVVQPNSSEKIKSKLLVATAGGRWVTTPNGFTYLSKPSMIICLDYGSPEHRNKTGNRVWTIKSARGYDKGCKIKGYQQPWFQKQN